MMGREVELVPTATPMQVELVQFIKMYGDRVRNSAMIARACHWIRALAQWRGSK